MQKLMITLSILAYAMTGFTQSAQYQTTMTDLVQQIQNTHQGSYMAFANKLERIAAAETTEWLPNYWAGYCLINESYTKAEAADKDMILEKAEIFVNKAAELSPNNAEIEILKANWTMAKLSADPMSRWQSLNGKFNKHLDNAAAIDPKNPRIFYVKAVNLYYTPEGFGGGKKTSAPLFEKALEFFKDHTNSLAYSPSWGKAESEYFLKQ